MILNSNGERTMKTSYIQTSSQDRRKQMQEYAERMLAVEAFRNNKISLKEVLAAILK